MKIECTCGALSGNKTPKHAGNCPRSMKVRKAIAKRKENKAIEPERVLLRDRGLEISKFIPGLTNRMSDGELEQFYRAKRVWYVDGKFEFEY